MFSQWLGWQSRQCLPLMFHRELRPKPVSWGSVLPLRLTITLPVCFDQNISVIRNLQHSKKGILYLTNLLA